MDNEQTEYIGPTPKPSRRPKRKLTRIIVVIVILLGVAAIGYVVVSKLTTKTANNSSSTENVLTVDDLNNPGTIINSQVSDASVDNLTKELEATIDSQVAAKENPISTVNTLINVLCTTTNTTRPMQCIDYITQFLATKMDTLKLTSDEYGKPSEQQITYWRAQFYLSLANNYKLITDNKFTGSDGKPLGTLTDQLKYVKLYLDIAQNPTNWGEPQIASDGHTWYMYEYKDTARLVTWRTQLEAGGAK